MKISIFKIQIFLIFFNFFIFINAKYIIIPLKKHKYNNDQENLFAKIYSNIFFTELSIGEPKQTIITFINTTSSSNIGILNKFCDSKLYINNPNINKDYSFENSSTFYQSDEGNMRLGTKDISINEQISFYTNFELTQEIKVQNLSILYNPNNEELILDDVGYDFIRERQNMTTCGYIGFKLGMKTQSINNNILNQLKKKDIISSTTFSFIEVNKNNDKYKNNNIEYLLLIGEEIYDIFNKKDISKFINEKYDKNIFVEKTKLNDYIINEGFYFIWKIILNDIYININNSNINMKEITNIFLDNDFGLISGTGEYRDLIEESFFKKYITINKCSKEILKANDLGNFYYYICDNDIDINNFPSLYLKSRNFQYEYILTKEDLFIRDNNKIYFLIVFEFSRTKTWKFGKPFLDKYLFSYNYDAKTISFYNEKLIKEEKEKSNNYNKYIIIVIILLLLIALIIGFFIGKNIYTKRKGKDAYELDANLNYNYSNEEIKNKEKKGNFSINV